jgi:DNA-binding response OmpR family regulator
MAAALILLVEDDPGVRMVAADVLLQADYEVDVTGSVEGGCALIGCRAYDLVIVSGRLKDGFGTLVADPARQRGTKALVITGFPYDALSQYEFLVKPVRPQELVAAVQRLLARS